MFPYLEGNGFKDLYVYKCFSYMFITTLCLGSVEARIGPPFPDPLELELKSLVSCHVVLELNPAPLQEQPVL